MNNVRNLLTGSLVYIACIVLLSLACNVSSGLPVADVIGQWLYFDKSALVVAGCLLMAGLMMEKRYFLFYTGFVGIGNAGGALRLFGD